MFSIANLISRRAGEWADAEKQSASSAPGGILRHIDAAGKLREPQVRAVEVYLWSKFFGKNKRLADLVIDGDLVDSELAREYSCDDGYIPLAQFLVIFACKNDLPELENSVRGDRSMNRFEWEKDLRALLHDFPYPNYLYSLPMGAGKTYLMAAFIAIDLHFSLALQKDSLFAHNFIVFAPHAAKTAILPSLKTIREFDPGWVLPKSGADAVRREMHVEILDAPSAGKRSTSVNNPNLEKVNRLSQTRERGLVFITNAEKVVLERFTEQDELRANLGAEDLDKLTKTNELRERMAKIPNLAVFLDEVHHAYQTASGAPEKKLRDAVGVLGRGRNLRAVIGFSGTPFVPSRCEVGGNSLRLKQLQDVVYDFPLARGIGNFLKKPKVVRQDNVREENFVRDALDAFFRDYDREYPGGTRSKIAFYCPNIAALNEEIMPVVQRWYAEHRPGRNGEIFWYYTESSKKYPLPANALAEFHNLDASHSEKRVVLLVAVGKEGWDCRSLAAVALPRHTTTRVFVLQAACRCLREVRDASEENALIYLGAGNYDIFAEELRKNHDMSVQEFQQLDMSRIVPVRKLKTVGKLRYTQVESHMAIESSAAKSDEAGELAKFLRAGFAEFKARHNPYARRSESHITRRGALAETVTTRAAGEPEDAPGVTFWEFLIDLSLALYGRISAAGLSARHGAALQKIHGCFQEDARWFRDHPQGEEEMRRAAMLELAACFAATRKRRSEIITEEVEIDLLEWKSQDPHIAWGAGRFLPEISRVELPRIHSRSDRLEEYLEESGLDKGGISFNYVPYRFDSDFERNAIRVMLKHDFLRDFELYYNGMTDPELRSFQIRTPNGVYTPDFLLLQREGGRAYNPENPPKIEKVLIIETKGKPYYDDAFKAKVNFIEGDFQRSNPNFRYFPAVDEAGNNDFTAHVDKLRDAVADWARA